MTCAVCAPLPRQASCGPEFRRRAVRWARGGFPAAARVQPPGPGPAAFAFAYAIAEDDEATGDLDAALNVYRFILETAPDETRAAQRLRNWQRGPVRDRMRRNRNEC